jgi:hypothetical protein
MFVGNSTREGYGMPTVLNLETGAITTQYHVVIDDWFKTVHSHADEKIDFDHDDWYKTFGLTEWQYIPDDHDCPTPEDPPQADSEGVQKLERSRAARDRVLREQSDDQTPSRPLTAEDLRTDLDEPKRSTRSSTLHTTPVPTTIAAEPETGPQDTTLRDISETQRSYFDLPPNHTRPILEPVQEEVPTTSTLQRESASNVTPRDWNGRPLRRSTRIRRTQQVNMARASEPGNQTGITWNDFGFDWLDDGPHFFCAKL